MCLCVCMYVCVSVYVCVCVCVCVCERAFFLSGGCLFCTAVPALELSCILIDSLEILL